MFGKKEKEVCSEKYRDMLLPIKAKIMKEIATYLKNGTFTMSKETVINYPMHLGSSFPARFDFIEGDENKLKLRSSETPYILTIKFDKTEKVNVEPDIVFLTTLLDYVDMDSRA